MKKRPPPPSSYISFTIRELETIARDLPKTYRQAYFDAYGSVKGQGFHDKTTGSRDPEAPEYADPTGDAAGDREWARDQLYVASDEIARALKLMQSAQGRIVGGGKRAKRKDKLDVWSDREMAETSDRAAETALEEGRYFKRGRRSA